MIFLGGVHAVGKSCFCSLVREEIGLESYSASSLIAKREQQKLNADKLVNNVGDNQLVLSDAVREIRRKNGDNFILDGHFCLLDKKTARPLRVPRRTFSELNPKAIVLLTERPEIISERRKVRDNVNVTPKAVAEFQAMEEEYAKEIAKMLSARMFISTGSEDLKNAIDFLRTI